MNRFYSQQEKVFEKKDLRTIIFGGVFVFIMSSFLCKNIIVSAVIAGVGAVVSIVFYFVKVAGYTLDENTLLKYLGMFGMFYSFLFTLLTSYQNGETFIDMLKTFLILIGVELVIIGLMEFTYRKTRLWDSKSGNKAVSAGLVSIFAALGVLLSRYMRKRGIEINVSFIYGGLAVVFSLFYAVFIKRRKNLAE